MLTSRNCAYRDLQCQYLDTVETVDQQSTYSASLSGKQPIWAIPLYQQANSDAEPFDVLPIAMPLKSKELFLYCMLASWKKEEAPHQARLRMKNTNRTLTSQQFPMPAKTMAPSQARKTS